MAALLAMVLASGSLLAFAVLSRGNPVKQLDIHDSGVWVSSDNDGMFGRMNKSADAIDALFTPPGDARTSYALDVRQDRSVVVAWDRSGGQLFPVDVERGQAIADRALATSPDSSVDLRGGTLAVSDPRNGKVRATRFAPDAVTADLAALDSTAPTLIELGASQPSPTTAGRAASVAGGAALVVGLDGSVYAASSTGKLVVARSTPSGFESPQVTDQAVRGADLELTVVGSTPVVLDRATGAVWIGDRSVSLGDEPDAATRLQQPGPASDVVLVATSKALYAVPLSGGEVRTLFAAGTGQPAAPVRVGACAYAAWASPQAGAVAQACGNDVATPRQLDRQTALSEPIFRVNRDQLVLNDARTGRVFDLDTLRTIDNWQQLRNNVTQTSQAKANHPESQPNTDLKPKAKNDELGARPNRTTVLNVLDNDQDPAGGVLAIIDVTPVEKPGVSLTIAPDKQTLLLSLPDKAADVSFTYTVQNGASLTAQAPVTVSVRKPTDEEAPTLRTAYEPKAFAVVAGQTVSLPVAQDWRDYKDGDPIQLLDAKAPTGTARVTPTGTIEYTPEASGAAAGVRHLTYRVSDGVGDPVEGKVDVTVLDAQSTAVAAITQPDVVIGQVGSSVVVDPLRNDLPGADPLTPTATLKLAGNVAPKDHLQVDTDLQSGRLTMTSDKAGTYMLAYTVQFGGAPFAPGVIRVDIVPPPDKPAPPITMPDFAAVHGQVPAMSDVLANDLDPAGGLLTVQAATVVAPNDTQLQVDVVRGRWLRITPLGTSLTPSPAVVRYTVSNGSDQLVTGDVTVIQLPAITPDPPRTRDDRATVRDGDSVLVPVLDNDSTESGAFLHLAANSLDGPKPGELPIYDPTSTSGTPTTELGTAYVSHDQVRYVAPAKVDIVRTVRIAYLAENDDGDLATGNLYVTINPQPTESTPDRAPLPPTIEARAASGEQIKIPVPTSGIDPDGDSTMVTGVGSATKLGRVVATSPNAITYQAYPTGQGTDEFSYVVVDRYGKTGIGTVRVSVVPAGDPVAPVAMPDVFTVRPGAAVTAYVLANDLVSPSDPATIVPLTESNQTVPTGVTLTGPEGPVSAVASDDPTKSLVVSYQATNSGGASAPVTLTIRSKAGFDNPPVAPDVVAKLAADGKTATVDLVSPADGAPSVFDIDGPTSAIKLVKTGSTSAVITGMSVTVPVTTAPQAIPYEVADGEGAFSSAVIFVPGAGDGLPFVKSDALIKVPQNGQVQVDLAQYVIAPTGKPVSLTTADRLWASPAGPVGVKADSATSLTVSGSQDYIGPGAITLEVSDTPSWTDSGAKVAIVTIPVQVGPDTPVLRCPQTPLSVVEGGQPRSLNVTAVCHVWTPASMTKDSLRYHAEWSPGIDGVDLGGQGTQAITATARGSAKPGSTGAITITVDGTQAVPAKIPVTVLAAPKATLAPVNLDGIKQGDTATVAIGDYMRSPLVDKSFNVVSVTQTSGMPATKSSKDGTLTLTPDGSSYGTMTFAVVATDVADTSPGRQDRWVNGVVTLKVYGVPDAPGKPAIGSVVQSHAVNVSWSTPDNHGAPIDHYEVTAAGVGGKTQSCQASPCNITGLQNAQSYTFTVKAINKAGPGKDSPPSNPATPDQAPTPVTGFKASNPVDHGLTLSWVPVSGDFSPVTGYRIVWPGGGSLPVAGGATSSTAVGGLVNDNTYDFTIVALNGYVDPSPPANTQGQSSGAPLGMGAPTIGSVAMAGGSAAAVTVKWSAADPNGPTPVTYTVNRTGGSGPKVVCSNVQTLQCNDDGVTYDGTAYAYAVTATNATGGAAHSTTTPTSPFKAIGTPLAVTNLSATASSANTITVNYTTVNSRGASSWVKIYDGSTFKGQKPEPAGGGTSSSQSFTQAYDGNTHTYHAVVCNETTCGPNGNTSSAKPWTNPTLVTFNVYSSGTGVYAQVSANGGGLPAHLTITASGTHNWSWSGDFTDGFSNTFTIVNSYSVNDNVSANLTDTSGRGRTIVYSASPGPYNVTTPAPPPYITAWKSSDVRTASVGTCTSASAGCYGIDFQVHNFPTGRFTWSCANTSGVFYNSSSTVNVTNPNQSFTGSTYCLQANGVSSQLSIILHTPQGDYSGTASW